MPVQFGDPRLGFTLSLVGEGISSSGIEQYLRGSNELVIGDGSASGHHISMSVIDARTVVIVLSSKPRDTGGVILSHATPASPYWDKIVRTVNTGDSPYLVGVPGLVRRALDCSVEIFVITG